MPVLYDPAISRKRWNAGSCVGLTEDELRGKLGGKEKEQYIDRLFALAASRYDLLNSIISLGKHRGWRRTAVRMSNVPTGGSALDVATGTGDFALELWRSVGMQGHVVGVDFCKPMLDLADGKLGKETGIELAVANAASLPFASCAFDCVTIGFALRNVADVRAVIAEMVRVTKPGGRVVSLEIMGPRSWVMVPLWRIYFFWLAPLIAQLLGAKRAHYKYLPESVELFYTRDELAGVFRDCGLTDICIHELMLGTVCIHIGTKR